MNGNVSSKNTNSRGRLFFEQGWPVVSVVVYCLMLFIVEINSSNMILVDMVIWGGVSSVLYFRLYDSLAWSEPRRVVGLAFCAGVAVTQVLGVALAFLYEQVIVAYWIAVKQFTLVSLPLLLCGLIHVERRQQLLREGSYLNHRYFASIFIVLYLSGVGCIFFLQPKSTPELSPYPQLLSLIISCCWVVYGIGIRGLKYIPNGKYYALGAILLLAAQLLMFIEHWWIPSDNLLLSSIFINTVIVASLIINVKTDSALPVHSIFHQPASSKTSVNHGLNFQVVQFMPVPLLLFILLYGSQHSLEEAMVREFLLVLSVLIFSISLTALWVIFLISPAKATALSASQYIENGYLADLPNSLDNEIGAISEAFYDLIEREEEKADLLELEVHERKMKEFALVQARREAESASVAKSDFLAVMSHEIRTPMNGVLGMSQMLTKTHLDPSQRKMVNTIAQSGNALMSIINDILDISKIEAGKVQLEYRPTNVVGMLENIINISKPTVKGKSVSMSFEPSTNVEEVLILDSTRMRQVILNFVSNAIKFTKVGNITIKLECVHQDKQKNEQVIKISVVDTGIGIPRERIDGLFTKFAQVDTSTTRKYGGTGLGLAICKELTGLMGGRIGVESEVGKGTVFWIKVPAKIAKGLEASDEGHVAFEQSASRLDTDKGEVALSATEGGRMNDKFLFNKMLLVEDTIINQEVALLMLEDYCGHIDVAENGQEAVDKVRNNDYDIILMDCLMPIMDGYEASRTIRNMDDKFKSQVIIVAVTASATVDCMKACSQSGMNDYLTKPFSQEGLESVLKKWSKLRMEDKGESCEKEMESENEEVVSVNDSVIDLQRFTQLQKILGARFQQFVKNYIIESERKFEELKQANKERNSIDMERLVHSLKSGAANFGSVKMSDYAQQLEDKYHEGDIIDAPIEIERIALMFDQLKVALNSKMDN